MRLRGGTPGLEPQERPPPVRAGTLHILRRTALHGDRVRPTNIYNVSLLTRLEAIYHCFNVWSALTQILMI